MRTIDGRSYAEDEDARRLEKVILDTVGLPVKLRVVDGRLKIDSDGDLIRQIDIKAEAGMCQMTGRGAYVFLKDIRRMISQAGIQGGLTKFEE